MVESLPSTVPIISDPQALQARSKHGWAQLCDGAGLCSPGVREPRARSRPPQAAFEFRRIALRMLTKHVAGDDGAMRTALSQLLGGRGESLFTEQALQETREAWATALGNPSLCQTF